MYIIYWILWFVVLILLHELWHFLACRVFWVKVEEFGIWIPPKLKTIHKDKKWTEYTLNLLPLWGFIRPKWEDLNDESQIYDKDSLHSQAFWKKFVILIAWVLMNLLIAFLIFFWTFLFWIKPILIIPDAAYKFTAESYLFPTNSFAKKVWYIQEQEPKPIKVDAILQWDETLASKIGIQTWDKILSINNQAINTNNIWTTLKGQIWKEFELKIERNQKLINVSASCPEDSCLLWIQYSAWRDLKKLNMSASQAFFASLNEIKAQTILTFEWLNLLYKKISSWQAKEAVDKLSWPVAAVAVSWYVLQLGILEYIAFFWMISLALAIFNVLPIPALDWWRIFTTAIMHIFRLNPKKYLTIEWYIAVFFFTLLMFLWFYIMYNDYIRFF